MKVDGAILKAQKKSIKSEQKGGSEMLAEQRFELILRELNASRAASVPRLCELTGASESLVKVRIHRAKGKLQELLEDLRKSGEI